jgi:hypothetical protein
MRGSFRVAAGAVVVFIAFVVGVYVGYIYGWHDSEDRMFHHSQADAIRRATESKLVPAPLLKPQP